MWGKINNIIIIKGLSEVDFSAAAAMVQVSFDQRVRVGGGWLKCLDQVFGCNA